jgi:aspartate 1-decarboxylase
MKTFVAAKIHNIRVTDKSVNYHGSVGVSTTLMQATGIEPYEQVHIINLNNGNRWITYAVPTNEGAFTLNGGGARLGEIGDVCVILSYRQEEVYSGATVVYCDAHNQIAEVLRYARA